MYITINLPLVFPNCMEFPFPFLSMYLIGQRSNFHATGRDVHGRAGRSRTVGARDATGLRLGSVPTSSGEWATDLDRRGAVRLLGLV